MPRVIKEVYEYYDNRIVWGFHVDIVPDPTDPTNTAKNAVRISSGGAAVNRAFIETSVEFIFPSSDFVVNDNVNHRTDIIVLDTLGVVQRHPGVPSGKVYSAPVPIPALTLLLAQITIPPGWTKFHNNGAHDETLCPRTQHVIDTTFVAP